MLGFLVDPEFWARWLGIVVINLLLSGDNALVIALAVRTLPSRQQAIGRVWGTAGAVVLRLMLVGVVTVLLRIPLLQLAGGLLLLWIAFKLVQQETGAEAEIRHGASLREAIWIIIVADLAMSLDNVLAIAAAADGDLLLVGLGIALSIPFVVWGAGLLARLMNRYTWIVWLGGGILGYVAGEMILKDLMVRRGLRSALDVAETALPWALAVVLTGCGWWFGRRHRMPDPDAPAGQR